MFTGNSINNEGAELLSNALIQLKNLTSLNLQLNLNNISCEGAICLSLAIS